MAKKFKMTLLPPYEKKGSQIPVTGIMPTVMPILTRMWQSQRLTAPIANNLP
jgi:hypothetical protein